MINVINNSHDPYFNLALEEYFVKHKNLDDDVLILWQNDPVIVIGKNQNAYEELNLDYVNSKNIKVVRRLSGGGAVYHDEGNLNFTIIMNDATKYRNDFSFFSTPVVLSLAKLEVTATFSGRNDILIDGKKFSGNAQYFYKDKVLHHGTLLFSSDLTVLSSALKVKKEKYESKGVKSVKSRVTNISEYLDKKISVNEFKEFLVNSIFENRNEPVKNYNLTDEDIEKINDLVKNKYGTWEWDFGRSPKFNYQKEMRFNAGSVSVSINVDAGIIADFKLHGDFFEESPIEEFEKMFVGKRFDNTELENIIKDIDVSKYILNLKNEDFIELFK